MPRQKLKPVFNPNACDECDYIAKTRTGLSSHKRGTHGNNNLPEEPTAVIATKPTVKLRQSWRKRRPAPLGRLELEPLEPIILKDLPPKGQVTLPNQDAFAIADSHVESARQVLRTRKVELEELIAERANMEEELKRVDARLGELGD